MRTLFSLAYLLCLAQAETECSEDGEHSVLLQGKLRKRQDHALVQSEATDMLADMPSTGAMQSKEQSETGGSIGPSLLARASKLHDQRDHQDRAVDSAIGTKANADNKWGKETCHMERTMDSKGTQHFQYQGHKSKVSGKWHRYASEEEFAILDEINLQRRKGFSCTDPSTGKSIRFNKKCRNQNLIFDCRLWFAARQHSEDMGKRDYYAHDTKQPFPSGNGGSSESFHDRVKAYAWNMYASKETLYGAWGDADTAANIVNEWKKSPLHCMAMGTNDAELAAIGRAPCTANEFGRCIGGAVGNFTTALFTRRSTGDPATWELAFRPEVNQLDTSCYPSTRSKKRR